MTRWYCPAVNYVAKMHIERTRTGVAVGAVASNLDSELVHVALAVDTSRYDGEWIVTRACETFHERAAFTDHKRLTVRGSEFILAFGTPGQPGYSRVSGRASDSGTLMLDGTGVSNAQASRGHEYRARFEGRFGDDGFALNGHYGARKCALTMTRAGG